MVSVENTCTFGITILALIVWLHAWSYFTVTRYICNTSFVKCPDDITFNTIRYASLIYVGFIGGLIVVHSGGALFGGILWETLIPLIVAVLIWIIGVIFLQVSDPNIQYVVGVDNTNLTIPVSNSPLHPVKVFREAYKINTKKLHYTEKLGLHYTH